MNDKEFWMMMRSALLMIISAIEKRYRLGRWSDSNIQEVGERDSMAIP
jgi:hypothetical protein